MASSNFHLVLLLISSLSISFSGSGATPTRQSRSHLDSHPRPPRPPIGSPTPSTGSIHHACLATRSPRECESALSQIGATLPHNASASDVTLAAMSLAAHRLQTAQTTAKEILRASSSSNPNRSNAARNCLEFLSFSDSRLTAAMKSLRSSALADARAFAGAAELYQYDCWSALKYVNGTNQVDDAMSFLVDLGNITGGATAMVSALQRYGRDMSRWGPPETERDGYWPSSTATESGMFGILPAGARPNVKVCKQGTAGGCQFTTVQRAVDAAPEHSTRRFVIYVKAGVYKETIRIGFEKTNLVLIGDGMGKTIITGSLNADMAGISTYNTATVGVTGDGFMATNLTFANTAGPDVHQAVAFRSDSDRSILDSVEFLGHQDTLYAHSLRQFYRSCRISGTVDFIFGNSASIFRNCQLFFLPRQLNPQKGETNTLAAHGRTDPAQPTGFVFDSCVVDGSREYLDIYRSKPAKHKAYLGRPWKEYSRTVFLNCKLGEIVSPEGWKPWSGDFALQSLFYGEYGSSGAGAKPAARVPWSSQIPAEHLGVYSLRNFIQGDRWIPSNLQSYAW